MATIFANRTALQGSYALGFQAGTFVLGGNVLANSARLDPSMFAGVTRPLAAAAKLPSDQSRPRSARQSSGRRTISIPRQTLRVVNFPGGGAARIQNASIPGPQGAQARIFGGSGITYYWPVGGLRIDSDIQMAGGGLPSGRVTSSRRVPAHQ